MARMNDEELNPVSIVDLKEYSMLVNKCYSPNDPKCCLPTNWTALYYYDGRLSDGNLYGLFINEKKKEIVFGIKGTDIWNLWNWMSNAKVVLGGRPIGQNDAVRIAGEALERCKTHQREAIQTFINSIQGIDKELRPELSKINLIALYVMLMPLGIHTAFLPFIKTYLKSVLLPGQSFNITDLMKTSERIEKHLTESLDQKTMKSVDEFSNAKQGLVKSFEGYEFIIVGHSLGAVMAELCAVELGVKCISIESPGAKEIIENIRRYKNKNDYLIITYLSAPNIVNTLHSHFKDSYRMFLPHTEDGTSFLHVVNSMFYLKSRISLNPIFAVTERLVGGLIGLWNDINWLQRQHSLSNIIAYLEKEEHVQIKPIIEWPKLTRNVADSVANGIVETFTFAPFNLSEIRLIMNEEDMRENNIERMTGYNVKK